MILLIYLQALLLLILMNLMNYFKSIHLSIAFILILVYLIVIA